MDELTSTLEQVRQIARAHQQGREDWVRARELTLDQMRTLSYLLEHPGAIQRDIALAARTSPATISIQLTALEKRGYIERQLQVGDDRSKHVIATPAAGDLVAAFQREMAAADEAILAPLGDSGRAALRDLVQQVVSGLPERPRSG